MKVMLRVGQAKESKEKRPLDALSAIQLNLIQVSGWQKLGSRPLRNSGIGRMPEPALGAFQFKNVQHRLLPVFPGRDRNVPV